MKNKRASAHLEMILSFVIFIGFIFFILIFIKPFGESTLVDSVTNGLHDSFVKNSSTELTTLFLKLGAVPSGCINISLPEELMSYDASSASVFDDGNFVVSQVASDGFRIDNVTRSALHILVSPEFESGSLTSCTTTGGYVWGGVVEEKVISNQSLFEMAERYENDYENLKTELGIPGVFDFGIISEVVTMERTIPENLDVVATDYIEKVVFSDGQIKNVRFSFLIW